MIYELRVYKCVPGRLPALINRFATITLKLWDKHGIKQAGFWTTLVGEEGRRHRCQRLQPVPDADGFLVGEVTNHSILRPASLARRAHLA